MSQPELTRLEVIQRVKRKTLKQRQAAELLSVSLRQVKRLCKAYQANGASGLISKRRGQPSNNRLPEKAINKARQLLRTRYPDFGPTLAAEKRSTEGVSLSVETVRQLLIGEGLWKAKSVVLYRSRIPGAASTSPRTRCKHESGVANSVFCASRKVTFLLCTFGRHFNFGVTRQFDALTFGPMGSNVPPLKVRLVSKDKTSWNTSLRRISQMTIR